MLFLSIPSRPTIRRPDPSPRIFSGPAPSPVSLTRQIRVDVTLLLMLLVFFPSAVLWSSALGNVRALFFLSNFCGIVLHSERAFL